jgi:hypothetical protein
MLAEPCKRAIEPGQELIGPFVEAFDVRKPGPASGDGLGEVTVRRDVLSGFEGLARDLEALPQPIDEVEGLLFPAAGERGGAEDHRPVEATLRSVLTRPERPRLLLVGVEANPTRGETGGIRNQAPRGADQPTVKHADFPLAPGTLAGRLRLWRVLLPRAGELEASQETLHLLHASGPAAIRVLCHGLRLEW